MSLLLSSRFKMQNHYQNNQDGQFGEESFNGNRPRSVRDVWKAYNLQSAAHWPEFSELSERNEWELNATGDTMHPLPYPTLAETMAQMLQSDSFYTQSVGQSGETQAPTNTIPLTGPAGNLLGNEGGYHWRWEPSHDPTTASSPVVPSTSSPQPGTSESSVMPEVPRKPKVPAAQADYTRSLTLQLYTERILQGRRVDESNDDVTARFIATAYGYTSVQAVESQLSPAGLVSYGVRSSFASIITHFKIALDRVDGTPAQIIAEAGVTCFEHFLRQSGRSLAIGPEQHEAARMRMWARLATKRRFAW